MRVTVILAILLVAGCVKYEYEIVDPPGIAPRIGSEQDVVFQTAAGEYVCRASGERLVLRIYNRDQTSLLLDGTRSSIISPDGQSRPVLGQALPPGSFLELILPPPLPIVTADSPDYGYGYGFSYGFYYSSGGHHHPRHYKDRGDRYRHGPYRPYRPYYYYPYAPFWYGPASYTVYDPSNPFFWTWEGETQITLTLAFDRAGQLFEDRFVIQRRRVE